MKKPGTVYVDCGEEEKKNKQIKLNSNFCVPKLPIF